MIIEKREFFVISPKRIWEKVTATVVSVVSLSLVLMFCLSVIMAPASQFFIWLAIFTGVIDLLFMVYFNWFLWARVLTQKKG
jgi:hypothetical protein